MQEEATYIQEIMATADGQMVQHLVATENQVSPPPASPGGELWALAVPPPPIISPPLSF